MPIYEYRCEKCGANIEVMQKIADPAPSACEKCGGGPMAKQLSKSSFALKGTGWYVTDFKGGSAPKEPGKGSGGNGGSSGGSES